MPLADMTLRQNMLMTVAIKAVADPYRPTCVQNLGLKRKSHARNAELFSDNPTRQL